MKPVINNPAALLEWLKNPVPAVFYGQDLTASSDPLSKAPLKDCVFLGCKLTAALSEAIACANCFLIPERKDVPFDAFTPGLYSPDELYDLFDPANAATSYKKCRDYLIYESYFDTVNKQPKEVDLDITLLRRLHDSSITSALEELLNRMRNGWPIRHKAVSIMGGHDRGRDEPIYEQTALLALQLAQNGFVVVTGGGPGLMEAANLGAYANGFSNPEQLITTAIATIRVAPKYNDPNWLAKGYLAWKQCGKPQDSDKALNIGIPTWFYGHEPPNVFATHIAKYFENSVREEGMLAIALGGIIYAEGNGGTVQEIFQDACQNYYKTYGSTKSAMVLFGSEYWNPSAVCFNDLKDDKRKPVYQLLHKLATEKQFDDYLLVSNKNASIVDFLKTHPPQCGMKCPTAPCAGTCLLEKGHPAGQKHLCSNSHQW